MVLKGGNLAQTKFYDHTSVSYEDTIKKMQYGGPRDVAKMVLKHVPDKDSKIIDVVAGTGLLGAELKANGYTNVDAIDGSKRMLDIAMSRDIYNKHYCELLEENKITSLRRGFYDAAVATGCFGAGHLNNGHFLPIVKMVRKGGKLVFGINDAYFKDSPLWGEDGSEWDHDLLAAIKGRPIHKLHKQYYVRLLVQTEP